MSRRPPSSTRRSTLAPSTTLCRSGPTPISGQTGAASITNAAVTAGTYTVAEAGGPAGCNAGAWGCTGGALWSDEFRPGPIYLQGDHTSVDYRKMVLRPVVK